MNNIDPRDFFNEFIPPKKYDWVPGAIFLLLIVTAIIYHYTK